MAASFLALIPVIIEAIIESPANSALIRAMMSDVSIFFPQCIIGYSIYVDDYEINSGSSEADESHKYLAYFVFDEFVKASIVVPPHVLLHATCEKVMVLRESIARRIGYNDLPSVHVPELAEN